MLWQERLILLAGYSENREQNYEMKYLRKVLGQVDKRIQVPESISGERLRALIDDVESATPRDIAARRKRLTLRSAIAYAAAFALIVGLFYGTQMYRPEMITGGMQIASRTSDAGNAAVVEQAPEAHVFDTNDLAEAPAPAAAEAVSAEVAAQEDTGAAVVDAGGEEVLGVGGLMSTLLLEQDGYAYYVRTNDATDPDKAGYPVTIDIVNMETNLIEAQIDIDNMQTVESISASDGKITLTGLYGDGLPCGNVYESDGDGGYLLISNWSGTPARAGR